MKNGFIKVAATAVSTQVADCKTNSRALGGAIRQCADAGAKLIVTPQLSICGATAQELLRDATLLKAAQEGLQYILRATDDIDAICVVGLPIAVADKVYNSAAVLLGGHILGVAAQTYTDEHRGIFAPAPTQPITVSLCEQNVLLGREQLFVCDNMPNLRIGVTIGQEVLAPQAPHTTLAQAGATVLAHLDATAQVVGFSDKRAAFWKTVTAQCSCAAISANACDESSGHAAYGGQHFVAQNGDLSAQTAPFARTPAYAVIDVDILQFARTHHPHWNGIAATVVPFAFRLCSTTALPSVWPYPFVPNDNDALAVRVQEVLAIQANALAKRLQHVGAKHYVLGISGGLDSTLALLACQEACRIANLPTSTILCATMPCFGTTSRTKNNALALCQAIGVECRTIDISAAVKQHLADIGHDGVTDVAYENAQARMRTMVLMDIANAENGLVIGTGDLSESALGWCTYNGDHMSMYGVNADVPKTLIRYMVRYLATQADGALQQVLFDILDTPISPELLPAKDNAITQKTEELIGSYDVNDFILYYLVRWGMPPAKLHRLLLSAFPALSSQQAKQVLQRFLRRFFAQQFKRSCAPDSPRIGSVSLATHDYAIPTDACAAIWLNEVDAL